jgi:hypothetical protein
LQIVQDKAAVTHIFVGAGLAKDFRNRQITQQSKPTLSSRLLGDGFCTKVIGLSQQLSAKPAPTSRSLSTVSSFNITL